MEDKGYKTAFGSMHITENSVISIEKPGIDLTVSCSGLAGVHGSADFSFQGPFILLYTMAALVFSLLVTRGTSLSLYSCQRSLLVCL